MHSDATNTEEMTHNSNGIKIENKPLKSNSIFLPFAHSLHIGNQSSNSLLYFETAQIVFSLLRLHFLLYRYFLLKLVLHTTIVLVEGTQQGWGNTRRSNAKTWGSLLITFVICIHIGHHEKKTPQNAKIHKNWTTTEECKEHSLHLFKDKSSGQWVAVWFQCLCNGMEDKPSSRQKASTIFFVQQQQNIRLRFIGCFQSVNANDFYSTCTYMQSSLRWWCCSFSLFSHWLCAFCVRPKFQQ